MEKKLISKKISQKRMYVLLRHYMEMGKEIQSLYPEEEELIKRYRYLDKAFNEAIDAEVKYKAGFYQRQQLFLLRLREQLLKSCF